MKKIVTHLWFDTQAKAAAEFYVGVFGQDSKITHSSQLHGTPSGDVDLLAFTLRGHDFMAISAGPYFKINPSISFHVNCKTVEEVDQLWSKLSPGGKVLMEIGSYPFSERYGWLEDKYGLSWQIIYAGAQPITQAIVPVLMFTNEGAGQAKPAIEFYTSVFHNSKIHFTSPYGSEVPSENPEHIKYGHFTIEGQEFGAMDSARQHDFNFNEAISFVVHCKDQAEIDYYWEKLSAVPEAEQCGWLKDQYGVSWQIVPKLMDELMQTNDAAQLERVTKAFLQMKKFNLAELQRAADGR